MFGEVSAKCSGVECTVHTLIISYALLVVMLIIILAFYIVYFNAVFFCLEVRSIDKGER